MPANPKEFYLLTNNPTYQLTYLLIAKSSSLFFEWFVVGFLNVWGFNKQKMASDDSDDIRFERGKLFGNVNHPIMIVFI